jgi:hypothetical protein
MSGRVIAGRYRLDEPIGRGAMGVVWRARDELLDRDVAVKEVLIGEALMDDEREKAYQRTLREARTAARLSHRGVVAVYDVAEDDGRPWIIMELVHSRSLDQILTASGPLSPRRAGQMGQQLLSALATAHAAGVLHRDVKPSNVLLAPDGRAVLTDFGIATFLGDPRLTQTGMVMGSPGYTAPERIRGGPATPASDLWSLGATLFTAVQGHGPFEQRGGAITTMSAIIHEDPPTASSAGPLGGIIAALLRREPSGRPDALTAARLIASLLPVLPDGQAGNDTAPSAVAADVRGGSRVAKAAEGAAEAVGTPGASGSPSASGSPVAARVAVSTPNGGGRASASGSGEDLADTETPGASGASGASGADEATDEVRSPSAAAVDAVAPPAAAAVDAEPASAGSVSEDAKTAAVAPAPSQPDWPASAVVSAPAPPVSTPGRVDPPTRPQEYPSFTPSPPRQEGAWESWGQRIPETPAASWSQRPDENETWREMAPDREMVPAPPAGRRGWRITLSVLAVALAAVAGAGAALVIRHHQVRHTGSSTTQATIPAPANGALAALDQPTTQLPAGDSPLTEPPSATGTNAGFSIGDPGGWSPVHFGRWIWRLYNPDNSSFLHIELTQHTFSDMLREAQYIRNDRLAKGDLPMYQQVALRQSIIRGTHGAIWEFAWTDSAGVRMHAEDMLFILPTRNGKQSYALYLVAPEARWASTLSVFEQSLSTFAPVTTG